MQPADPLGVRVRRALLLALAAGLAVLPATVHHPLVGHDFRYFLPRLVDTLAFLRAEGLAIQWWTPSFGGGLPAFANPQSLQLSLPQLLCFALDPFWAACASLALATWLGALALHRLARGVLGWDEVAACLLAVALATGGFPLLHLAAGHVGYHAFALAPVLLLVAVDPRIPPARAALLAGVVGAYFVYSGGHAVSVLAALALALAIPLVHLLTDRARGPLATLGVLAGGGALALALAAAKLVAVFSWMAAFPRLVPADPLPSLASPLLQLVTTPALTLFGVGGAPRELHHALYALRYGPWETDASLALPVVAAALGVAAAGALRIVRRGSARERAWLAAALVAAALVVVLAAGRGPLFAALKSLPILSSLRVNPRFTASLGLSVALLGALAFVRRPRAAWLATGFALLQAAGVALAIDRDPLDFEVTHPVSDLAAFAARVRAGERPLAPLERIEPVGDQDAVVRGSSSLHLYEPLIGEVAEYPARTALAAGPIRAVRGGAFNLNFPPAFVDGPRLGLAPFARIPESDEANLRLFVARRAPAWPLAPRQRAANALSLAAAGLALALGLREALRARRAHSAASGSKT